MDALLPLESLIINDSERILTDAHRRALIKGFSCIPAPSNQIRSREQDYERFRRSLNLRLQVIPFHTARSALSDILPSNYKPPDFISAQGALWRQFRQATATQTPPENELHRRNLTPAEEEAWTDLSNHPSTYLVQADKGGKAVLWRKADYRKEAQRQLADDLTYAELSDTEAAAAIQSVREERDKLSHILATRGHISASEASRLRSTKWEIPPIYFLPKVHKEKNASSNTFTGRPIIGATKNITKPLDLFLTKLTAPLLPLIPGSLRDTKQLLCELQDLPSPLPSLTTLFSADVVSLYPSIPWVEGTSTATRFYEENLQSVRVWCTERGFLPPPPSWIFNKILWHVLKNNIFHFQKCRTFRQLSGTAMGCSISVYLANTFLYGRMRQLLENPPRNLLYLGRYIDDVVGIWNGTDTEAIISSFTGVTCDKVKLTWVMSQSSLVVLDVLISLDSGTITTKVHHKPTDGNQFVHWSSGHPQHIRRSIPYAQLLRLKRICSDEKDFEAEAKTLLTKFKLRGYPTAVLTRALGLTKQRSRDSLLSTNTRTQTPSEALFFVTRYDERNHLQLKKAVRELHTRLLQHPLVTERQESLGTQPIPERPPIVAFSLDNNLGSALGKIVKNDSLTNG